MVFLQYFQQLLLQEEVEEVVEDLLLFLLKLEDFQVVLEVVDQVELIFHPMMLQEDREILLQQVLHKVIMEEVVVELQIKEQGEEEVQQL
jgi:hypothetical protein